MIVNISEDTIKKISYFMDDVYKERIVKELSKFDNSEYDISELFVNLSILITAESMPFVTNLFFQQGVDPIKNLSFVPAGYLYNVNYS